MLTEEFVTVVDTVLPIDTPILSLISLPIATLEALLLLTIPSPIETDPAYNELCVMLEPTATPLADWLSTV